MRIDAHQHFWNYDPIRDGWITEDMSVIRRDFLPEHLKPLLDEHAIDGTIAVQADQSERETEFLLQLANGHPFIKGVVGWVDLLSPSLEARLEHFSAYDRLLGVRHIAQAEADDFLGREDVARGIASLDDFGLTYDILVYSRQLPAALVLCDKLPESRFVLDHIAKPSIRDGEMEPWATHMRELSLHPGLVCKVSGLVTEADWNGWSNEDVYPYLDVVFDSFGPDRLLFGSDWPVCLLAADYARVMALLNDYTGQLSITDRDKVFGRNAAGFYGLAG
jgi:L-fuconolactonase